MATYGHLCWKTTDERARLDERAHYFDKPGVRIEQRECASNADVHVLQMMRMCFERCSVRHEYEHRLSSTRLARDSGGCKLRALKWPCSWYEARLGEHSQGSLVTRW